MAHSHCTGAGPEREWDWDQEQWVTLYYAELFTQDQDLEWDQTP